MFKKIHITTNNDIFNQLYACTTFEDMFSGRQGAVIGDFSDDIFHIVRTTTKYTLPSQKFNNIHYEIINKIQSSLNMPSIKLNNALIEIYNSKYRKMKYHSDQSLDLADDSYICVYSCYDKVHYNPRKLIIKHKITGEQQDIVLDHNSVVIFSTKTNSNYLHKIILPSMTNKNDTQWLGITFRLSKTPIYFKEKSAYFKINDKKLRVANEEETKEFYKLRGSENKLIDFVYPNLDYTISNSDMLNILV